MKKLLALIIAISVTLVLVGYTSKTVTKVETVIEFVEIEKIVIETRIQKLTEKELADIRTIIEYKVSTELEAELRDTIKALEINYDTRLATAIDELEPIVIYEEIVVIEIEYIEKIKYRTNTVYVDVVELVYEEVVVIEYLPSEIIYETVTEIIEIPIVEYIDVVEIVEVIVEVETIEYITEIVEVPVEVTVIEFVNVVEYITEYVEIIIYEDVFIVDDEAIEAVTLEFNDYKATHKYSNLQFLSTVDAMMSYVARVTELEQEIAELNG